MEYYKTYIQMEGEGGEFVETVARWGLYCGAIPFKFAGEAKEVSARNWMDEDGLDEYISPDGLRMAYYDLDVTFCFKGSKFEANPCVTEFLKFIVKGKMMLYSEYLGIGRRHVRYLKVNDDATLVRSDDGDILYFTVTFRVGDPVTEVVTTADEDGNVNGLVAV